MNRFARSKQILSHIRRTPILPNRSCTANSMSRHEIKTAAAKRIIHITIRFPEFLSINLGNSEIIFFLIIGLSEIIYTPKVSGPTAQIKFFALSPKSKFMNSKSTKTTAKTVKGELYVSADRTLLISIFRYCLTNAGMNSLSRYRSSEKTVNPRR